jgi:hypothetical protein
MRKMLHKTIAAGLLVLAPGLAAVAHAQSLGEIARLEAERRSSITKRGKLYTNESLRPEPEPAPGSSPPAQSLPPPSGKLPAAAAPAVPAPEGPGQGAPPGAADPKSERYWRGRIAAARDGLARAQTFAEALQSRINALDTDFVNRDDPAQREVIAADRQKAIAELERVRGEIIGYQKSIGDIQEEARRSGVPPGWLR